MFLRGRTLFQRIVSKLAVRALRLQQLQWNAQAWTLDLCDEVVLQDADRPITAEQFFTVSSCDRERRRFQFFGCHAYATGEYSIHFLHFTTPHGLTGILRSGILLPSSREAMGMAAPKMLPLGFFGKGHLDSSLPLTLRFAENAAHGKAGWSIAVTGQLAGTHVKFRRSGTEAEQRMLTRNICVRSSSSDGRWLFRSDEAVPRFVHLVENLEDESWGLWEPTGLPSMICSDQA